MSTTPRVDTMKICCWPCFLRSRRCASSAGTASRRSNILVLSPITAKSHTNIIKSLVNGLVDRGHSVTHWSGLKPDDVYNPNLRLLFSPELAQINSDHQIGFHHRDSPFQLMLDIPFRTATYCSVIYRDPIFRILANSSISNSERYDLVVMDAVFNECLLPLVGILDVPLVYFNCFAPTPWLLNTMGSTLSLDHFPHPGSNYVPEMGFLQRTFNTVSGFVVAYFHRWFVMSVVDSIASRALVDISNGTSVIDIEDRYMSVLLTNTHFSINYQLPVSPSIIHVGGLHCVPAKPLPEDLEWFVEGAGEAGVIIVSFGSILKGAEMPDHLRRLFLTTFAKLPQRVLWKWENASNGTNGFSSELPPNVRLMRWLPQADLLGHNRTRLFITHCGLCSKQEAVYHGVPFIALPVFADQPINAQTAHDDGYAIRLDWDSLTEDVLYDAIQRILHDPKYAERMRQVSALMRDQPDRPLDRATYWIEYVVRHDGASHLRSASRKLSLFQRCLFDVLLFVLAVALVFAYCVLYLHRLLCGRKVVLLRNFFPSRVSEKKKNN